jgi:proteasome-associated ATPase
MTDDARYEELEHVRGELAKQRINNERLTATLREARSQILTLKAEVDRLAEPPSAYGVYLQTLDDGTINILTSGRKMRVVATPTSIVLSCWSPARRSCSTRP